MEVCTIGVNVDDSAFGRELLNSTTWLSEVSDDDVIGVNEEDAGNVALVVLDEDTKEGNDEK